MKNFVFVFIVFLLLSCSSENGTKPELTNPDVQLLDPGENIQRNRDWDLVVRDIDYYDISLNIYSSNYSYTRWRGEVEYSYGSNTYTGDAWAFFDNVNDMFTVSCLDTGFTPPRTLTYTYTFDNEEMEGFFFYNRQYGFQGHFLPFWIVSGNIGLHGPLPNSNTPPEEFSTKVKYELD